MQDKKYMKYYPDLLLFITGIVLTKSPKDLILLLFVFLISAELIENFKFKQAVRLAALTIVLYVYFLFRDDFLGFLLILFIASFCFRSSLKALTR